MQTQVDEKRRDGAVQNGLDEHGDFVGFNLGGDRPLPDSPAAIVSQYPEWVNWAEVHAEQGGVVQITANDPSKFSSAMVEAIKATAAGRSVMPAEGSRPLWEVISHSLVDDAVLDVFTHTRMRSTEVEGLEVVHKRYH